MVNPEASRFWQAALRSGLIDVAGLRACFEAIPPEKRTAQAIDRRMARRAIELGHLTLWQAQQVLDGRTAYFQFGRYLLLDRIGQGGMGRVYLARDTRLNRLVALKVLSPERLSNPRALARFTREAKVGAQLQHENLVRIYDEGEHNGLPYLVMEYIEGKNAGQVVAESGPMPPAVAARVARQVALGLDHARQKGLIHRDVNPFNILITRDGAAKLTDLGLAIDLADDDAAVTRDGATVGTFDYISPEQARHSRSVDTRSDIYSLGCTLFHLIAGRVPFPLPSLPEKLYAHQISEPESLTGLVPDVPPGLAAIVSRMMRKKAEDRYASPGEVADALEPFALAAAASPGLRPGPATVSNGDATPTEYDSSLPPSDSEGSNSLAFLGDRGEPAPAAVMPKIDFGHEYSISQSLSNDRFRPGWGPLAPFSRGRAGLIAAALGMLIALTLMLSRSGCSMPDGRLVGAVPPANARLAPPQRAPAEELPLIAVHFSDGQERRFDQGNIDTALRDALQLAGQRGGGEVILRDRKPLHLTVDPDRPLIGNGRQVIVRAARDAHPTLTIEMSGRGPFLKTSAGSALCLRELDIEVRYRGDPTEPPPTLIRIGDVAEIDRCTFRAAEGSAGVQVVSCEGRQTTLTGCYFEGFDQPVGVTVKAAREVRLEHCMFFGDAEADRGPSWVVSFRRPLNRGQAAKAGKKAAAKKAAEGGSPTRPNQAEVKAVAPDPAGGPDRVEFDRCTIAGLGLIAAVGFTESAPLQVDVRETAVLAPALVCWKSTAEFPKGLRWSGGGNRYEVTGDAWIVRTRPPTEEGGPPIVEGVVKAPTGLDSWRKALADEIGTEAGPIPFAAGPRPTGAPGPAGLAIDGLGGSPPGADPIRVQSPRSDRPGGR